MPDNQKNRGSIDWRVVRVLIILLIGFILMATSLLVLLSEPVHVP
jgi:hypothetical protein